MLEELNPSKISLLSLQLLANADGDIRIVLVLQQLFLVRPDVMPGLLLLAVEQHYLHIGIVKLLTTTAIFHYGRVVSKCINPFCAVIDF